jgi:predicted aspartyl protease
VKWFWFPISAISAMSAMSAITRDHGDILRLAQFSPRRKHETVHRSSSWAVRIRRHTRGHFAHDFCTNANSQAGHSPLPRNRYIGQKCKLD